jgi:hypothetical protein
MSPLGCSRCSKLGRLCPGYRREQDLLFHNAGLTSYAVASTKTELKKKRRGKPSTSQSPLTGTLSPPVGPSNSNSRAVSLVLNLFSVAVPGSKSYGLFHFLPSLYREATPNSCLCLATTAVARAYEDNLAAESSVRCNKATNAYVKALSATNVAIRDAAECGKDSTIMAIWLLGVHQVCAEAICHIPHPNYLSNRSW